MIRISEQIGKGYGNAWYTNRRCRYRVIAGARNTKKSNNIGGVEPIIRILENDINNVLFIRQNENDHAISTFPNIIQRIEEMGLMGEFRIKTSPREIVYKRTGQMIAFKGLNNPTGITSIKPRHGVFNLVYFEEASEIRDYEDFRKVDGSIRIGTKEMRRWGVDDSCIQITLLMNPWNKDHWIHKIFFEGRMEDDPKALEEKGKMEFYDPEFSLGYGKGLYLMQPSYKINEFRSPAYDENMEILKRNAPEIYKVEGLGCWGNSTESTYPEWRDELAKTPQSLLRETYGAYCIGIDFGISDGQGRPIKGKGSAERIGSATTMSLMAITADGGRLVALDEWYFSNQKEMRKKTGPEIQTELIKTLWEWIQRYQGWPTIMKGRILVYVDSADSGGFRQGLELEARKQGLYEAIFQPSTKIPIQSRVDFMRTLMAYGDFVISDRCENLIREIKNARRADDGRPREDFDDHALNACEYGWAPLRERIRRWKAFKPH